MARLIIRIGGGLSTYLKSCANKRGRSEADIVRDALSLHQYFMEKVAEGDEVVVRDPATGETTIVNLTSY